MNKFITLKMGIFRKFTICIITLVTTGTIFGQTTTLFSDNFDPASSSWNLGSVAAENAWHIGSCAGNGISMSGDSAAYITNGTNVVCGPDYKYVPSGSTSSIILSHTINASCASGNLNVKFDYTSNPGSGDSFEIVYSTNGGSTWTSLSTLSAQATWFTSSTNALPITLAGTSFVLGFRFNYDNSVVGTSIPPAIDNVVVTGTDNISPILICPTADTIASSPVTCQSALGKVNGSIFSLTDNCSDAAHISFAQTPAITYMLNGHLDDVLVHVVVTDEAGNSSSCDFTVVLVDITSPTAVCPPNTHQLLNVNCETTLANFNSYVLTNSTDNCGLGTTSQSPAPGTPVSGHGTVQPVTMTVNDAAGNSSTCTFNVEMLDSLAPTLTCPPTAPMYVNSSCTGVVPDHTGFIVQHFAHDSCSASGTITATQSLVAGTFLSSNQNITYTVTDAHNNSATCVVMLVLTDTIKPSIGCAASLYTISPTVNCSAPLPNYATLAPPTTSDNCPGTITVTQNPPPGTIVSGINNYIYLIAKDAAGNKDSCQFVVNISDVTNPIIVCPNDTVYASNNFCQGNLIDFRYLVTMSDNCADTFSLSQNFTQSPAIGTLMTGTAPIAVTLTTHDNSGNSSSCVLQVGLVDVSAPTIDPIPSFTGITDPGTCDFTLPNYASTAAAHDNCSADAAIILTQNPIAGTVLTGSGAHNIDIIAEDEAGNKDTLTIYFTVQDNSAPIISVCPSAQTVYATATCDAPIGDYTALITVTDNCTANGDFTITQSPAAGTTINSTTVVTINVDDESGNTSNTCFFNALFVDTISPQLTCLADTSVLVDASCNYNIPNLVAATLVQDNCDASPTVTQSPLAGTSATGTTIVTLTATDATGNTSTCQVNILPVITPVNITSCTPDQLINTVTCSGVIADYTGLTTADAACGGATFTQIPASGTTLQAGNHTITIVATDTDNNTDTCTFNLLIAENTAPTITCPSDTITCDPIVNYTAPIGLDNCLAITTQTDATGFTSGSTFPIGTTTIEYTVADSSGNTTSCTFDINVLVYPGPAITMADTAICNVTSSIITAIAASSGTGQWTVINGGVATINNDMANSTGVNNLQFGDNTFVWTIQSPSCGNTTDTVTVTVYELPNPPAATLDEMFACNATSIEITGNTPTVGYGMWYDVNGVATFADSSVVPTTVSNLQSGWNYIVWSIGNGVCPISTDTIRIFANQHAVINPIDSLGTICSDDNSIIVSGIPPLTGFSSVWYISQGTGDIAYPSSSQTLINNLGVGENLIIYKLTSTNCDPSYDSIMVVVEDCNDLGGNFPTMITPNADGKNDLWMLDNLNNAYPACSVVIFDQWGNIVYKSTGYTNPWDGTFKNKPLPMGTYFYVIETKGTDNKVLKGNVSIIY